MAMMSVTKHADCWAKLGSIVGFDDVDEPLHHYVRLTLAWWSWWWWWWWLMVAACLTLMVVLALMTSNHQLWLWASCYFVATDRHWCQGWADGWEEHLYSCSRLSPRSLQLKMIFIATEQKNNFQLKWKNNLVGSDVHWQYLHLSDIPWPRISS